MTGAPEDSSHGDSAGNGDLVSQLARGTGVGFVGRVGGKALGLVLEALFALSLPFYVLLDVIASYLQALKRIDVQQFLQHCSLETNKHISNYNTWIL